MKAYQITVSAENKPGMLASITGPLNKEKINIRAISISSFGKSGFFNIITDDQEKALKTLRAKGLEATLKEIIAVLIDDRPGGLDKLIQLLAERKINADNAYGFVIESRKNAVFIIDTAQIQEALEIITKGGFKTLNSEALSSIEPFHYMKY